MLRRAYFPEKLGVKRIDIGIKLSDQSPDGEAVVCISLVMASLPSSLIIMSVKSPIGPQLGAKS